MKTCLAYGADTSWLLLQSMENSRLSWLREQVLLLRLPRVVLLWLLNVVLETEYTTAHGTSCTYSSMFRFASQCLQAVWLLSTHNEY